MADKMLKTFAKMGRASGLTRDELITKLAKFGTPEEVTSAVDEVMTMSDEHIKECVDRVVDSVAGSEE
jgi:hypothetical protein